MIQRIVAAAAMAAGLSFGGSACAKAPAPLVPTALVEDVTSASAEVEFMDYVGPGQTIALAPRDVLVLSYLKSCEHETITGGTVRVGMERSDVQGGKVVRAKVACNGGKMQLASAEANASGASAFRLQSVESETTLYALPPMVQLPKLAAHVDRTLVIERKDRPGERQEIAIGEALIGGAFYDLAKADMKPLRRGATYTARLAGHTMTFKVDAKARDTAAKPSKGAKAAKAKPAPVVSRLLRFPPG